MKSFYRSILTAALCFTFASAYAQMGGGMGRGPRGPQFGGAMAKLFGDNSAFSANLEVQTKGNSPGQQMSIPGKIAFDSGKSRFEMDLAQSGQMPPQAMAQMKAMGMDKMVMISRPDKKVNYMIYPNMQVYAETPNQDTDTAKATSEFKIDLSELGKEDVDGHSCIKNKAVVTDDEGKKHDYVIWSATDLKKFPIKIEGNEQGMAFTQIFKNVNLSKPEASSFEPPEGYKKYDSMQAMMQQEMMKRMGGAAGGMQPARPPVKQ